MSMRWYEAYACAITWGGIAVVAGIAGIVVAWRRYTREWHPPPFWPGWMRRKVRGEWHYRRATDEEEAERLRDEAW